MNVQVKAYAKLNLTLDITGAEGGYHLIDSVVTTVDVYDLISVSTRRDKAVTVKMIGMGSEIIPYESNNAVRAAQAFINRFNTRGADIVVYKNIPMGAGMGGSSADAAGVLNALKSLYKITDEKAVKQIADGIGSDVGYMLNGGYARITGRGEKVTPVNSDISLNFLILVPQEGVSTAECYSQYDNIEKSLGRYSGNVENALIRGDYYGICKNLSNALFKPACAILPDVAVAKQAVLSLSPDGVNMSGSGSAVYAVFPNAEFCRWAQSRYTGRAKTILAKTVNFNKKGSSIWQKKD